MSIAFQKKERRDQINWIWIFLFSLVIMSIVFLVIIFENKIETVLTLAITMFAGIEGFSAYLLYKTEKQKIIADELEKAYGPLYSIVSKPGRAGDSSKDESGRVIDLTLKERIKLDEIITTYPYMLPYDLIVEWRTKIKNQVTNFSVIRESLQDQITDEYDRRLMDYYEMVKGKKAVKEYKKKPKFVRA